MKVATILLLACISFVAAQTNIAFSSTAAASCTGAGGCSLGSIIDVSYVAQLVVAAATGASAAYNLDLTALGAGASVTIDSSGVLNLNKNFFLNNLIAGGQTTVTVASGITVNTANLIVQQSSTAVVSGVVQIQSSATAVTNFTIDATSAVYVQASGSINAGASNVQAAGSANVQGAISTTGSWTQQSGSLFLNSTSSTSASGTTYVYAAAGMTFAAASTLGGNGVIGGTSASAGVAVTVNGNINIGNSPGFVTINGDWRPSSTSVFKLEVQSSTQFDQLYVTGKAYVDGNLQVTLINNYAPAVGSRYNFIHAVGGTAGSFKTTIGTSTNTVSKWTSSVAANDVLANFSGAVHVAISGLVLVACVLASLL